jgi:hypothetical protein
MAARRENRKSSLRMGERRSNLIFALSKGHARYGCKNKNEEKDPAESLGTAQSTTTSDQITWMRGDLQTLSG